MTPEQMVVLDPDRVRRTGLEEAVFCSGKSVDQIAEILRRVTAGSGRMLLTRLARDKFEALPADLRCALEYDQLAAVAVLGSRHAPTGRHRVAIVAAGTSDAAVAREAACTLRYSGEDPLEVTDVGVAGLWRLLERLDEIRAARVVIAVAGMDAALPTVLGGLVAAPLIGVPTSVGYGIAHGGHVALNSMLASCAPGLAVMNIDNGYGAACAALRILRHAAA